MSTFQDNSDACGVQEHTGSMRFTVKSNFNLEENALKEKTLPENDIRLTGSDELQKI